MEVQLKILKFKDYMPRQDLIRTSWIRFEIDFLTHPDFYRISGDEIKVFMYFICIAGRMQTENIRMDIEHTADVLHLDSAVVLSAIEKLAGKRWKILKQSEIRTGTPLVSVQVEKNRIEENRVEKSRVDQNRIEVLTTQNQKELNSKIWESYKESYLARYKTEPVRNAKANSLISQLAKRLGPDAVEVVSFFVKHNKQYYLNKLHDLSACIADAEALRTQWVHGRAITEKDVKSYSDAAQMQMLGEQVKAGGF